MILAAGFGTRLKPITDTIPKALIPFKKGTLISYQIDKLKNSGISEIIINTHHLSNKIEEYFKNNDFGIDVTLIKEDTILGTGGGILNAKKFLIDEKSFVVTNVDIYSDINIERLISFHRINNPLAVIAVSNRKTSRYLEADENMNLIKRADISTPDNRKYAFNGIHIISNRIFDYVLSNSYCDIIDIYISLLKKGEKVICFNSGETFFMDVGKPENINEINKEK